MAIYHLSIKIGGRSGGRSACAAAAYRAGDEVHDREQGKTHDYTKKTGVVHQEIILPEHAPEAWRDREELWNAVQECEKAGNAQLFREFELALPHELTRDEQIKLARDWAQAELVARGMCVDIAIHDKGDGNPHAHIMATTRALDERGKWKAKEKKQYKLDENGERVPVIDKRTGKQKVEKKTGRRVWERETVQANDWNDRARAEAWRASWERACNEKLPEAARIDHRSHARRGVLRVPGVHVGYGRNRAERREMNRRAKAINREARALEEEEKTLKRLGALEKRAEGIKKKKGAKPMDNMKSRLDALSARISGIEKGREDELEHAKETFRTAESAPDFLAAFKTLLRAVCNGNQEAASFINDNKHRLPEKWQRDWLYMTEAQKDEIRLRLAMRDEGEGDDESVRYHKERIDAIIKHWNQQQEEERKAARKAEKAAKEAKEREKASKRGRVRVRSNGKGGGGR